MKSQRVGAKLPGKTDYSTTTRRHATRKSGFFVNGKTTGGELQIKKVDEYLLSKDSSLSIVFDYPDNPENSVIGYGCYYLLEGEANISVINGNDPYTLTKYEYPNWNKIGNIWRCQTKTAPETMIVFSACENVHISLFDVKCGVVQHRHMDNARHELLVNMHQFAPESNFYIRVGHVTLDPACLKKNDQSSEIYLKSCNRCGRYLPINTHNENYHLSYTNHCTAVNRRPCKHSTFSHLKNMDTNTTIDLDFGFQLECRYCKKFEVNAAHNPQRTEAQMKEDAARRRGFEILLEMLYKGSIQLRFREKNGIELTDFIKQKFGNKCFSCNKAFSKKNPMHLDHTRPLSYLWPLDETATALCKHCNSAKSNKHITAYYSQQQIQELSKITGLSINELVNPLPNCEAIRRLIEQKDWFYNCFLGSEEMLKVRDGKSAGSLLINALDKIVSKCPGIEFSFIAEGKKRNIGGLSSD